MSKHGKLLAPLQAWIDNDREHRFVSIDGAMDGRQNYLVCLCEFHATVVTGKGQTIERAIESVIQKLKERKLDHEQAST